MTNNPTIDGVSPKRGDRLFHVGNTRACPRGWVEFLCFDGCGEATVRTKNGAVPSVQVDHLQWHAMTDEQQLQEFYSELSNGGKLSKRALCHIRDQQSTIAQLQARVAELESGQLAVWYGAMPESNGKTNWTAILHRKSDPIYEGCCITLDRSEYPDRVRYEADRARYLIGELAEEPFILDYDSNAHSGYTAPPAPVAVVLPDFDTWYAKNVGVIGTEAYKRDREVWRACLDATAALNGVRK